MSFIRTAIKWVETHQKGIRTFAVVAGAGCAVATPFLASKATSSVARKIHEANATTKEEKLKIARKDPWVWATAGTTLGSLGFGALSYGVSNRIISKANQTIDKLTDQIDTVTSAISELPEKEQAKLDKAVAVKNFEKQQQKEASGDFNPIKNAPVDTGFGDTIFYDTWTNTYFLSSYQKVMSVINELNDDHNHGITKTVADWCVKNGWKPQELDYDYYFMSMIELVKDGDHFYQVDDKGNPVGIIEFTYNSKPKHLSKGEAAGIPFI